MPVQCTCAQCGAAFAVKPSEIAKGRSYCSKQCYDIARNGGQVQTRTCQQCAKTFSIRPSFIAKGGGSYCSNTCKWAAARKGIERQCQRCNVTFYATAAGIKRGHGIYCGTQCYVQNRDYSAMRGLLKPQRLGQTRTCPSCSAIFYAKLYKIQRGQGTFCSHACRGVSQRTSSRDRWSWEYRAWRRAVFERDAFTCQRCGIRGGDLHAHHVKGWARYPALRFEVSNGMTLHERCHYEWHQEHGRW